MTLGTVVVAFALVAVLFLAVAWVTAGQPDGSAARLAAGEALVLTLVGALWIGSLGHGSWLLLFLFLGLLRFAFRDPLTRKDLKPIGLGLLKYLAAGALLAWRLG